MRNGRLFRLSRHLLLLAARGGSPEGGRCKHGRHLPTAAGKYPTMPDALQNPLYAQLTAEPQPPVVTNNPLVQALNEQPTRGTPTSRRATLLPEPRRPGVCRIGGGPTARIGGLKSPLQNAGSGNGRPRVRAGQRTGRNNGG